MNLTELVLLLYEFVSFTNFQHTKIPITIKEKIGTRSLLVLPFLITLIGCKEPMLLASPCLNSPVQDGLNSLALFLIEKGTKTSRQRKIKADV